LDIGYFARHGESCGRHEQKPQNDFSEFKLDSALKILPANVDEGESDLEKNDTTQNTWLHL
jgi:hypothetical protein